MRLHCWPADLCRFMRWPRLLRKLRRNKFDVTIVGSPEIEFLRGNIGIEAVGTTARALRPATRRPRLGLLRRAIRTASWMPLWRLPRALTAPDGFAVRHNALMRCWISQQERLVQAAYQDDLIDSRAADRLREVDAFDIGRQLAEFMTYLPDIPRAIGARLVVLLEKIFTEETLNAVEVLGCVRAQRWVPKLLLSGSGSQPANRALSLEVMRRGGAVMRFSHGGSELLFDNHELSGCTRASRVKQLCCSVG